MSADVVEQNPRRRPRAVTLVAWLHVLEALILVATGLFALLAVAGFPVEGITSAPLTEEDVLEMTLLGVFASALGILALLIAVGLLRLRSWAWLVAMTLQGVSLAISLVARVVGNPDELVLLIGVIVVLVLNQREVRDAFGRGGGQRV